MELKRGGTLIKRCLRPNERYRGRFHGPLSSSTPFSCRRPAFPRASLRREIASSSACITIRSPPSSPTSQAPALLPLGKAGVDRGDKSEHARFSAHTPASWGASVFSLGMCACSRGPTSGVSSFFETCDAITLLAGKNSFPCSPRSTARQRDVLLLSAKSRDPTRRRKSLKPPKLARNLHESTIQASKRLESPRIGFLRPRSRQRARAASDAAPTRSA